MKSLPMPTSLKISDDCVITFSDSIRNLGFFIDSELKFTVHIIKVCQACFLELRRVSSIRHLLSTDATKTLVISLVLSRLDYCNSLLFGLPNTVLSRFQRIQNAAARLVLRLPRRGHVTPALSELHWLPVKERITYKIGCLCYKISRNIAPSYVSDMVNVYTPGRVLRSSNYLSFDLPRFNSQSRGERSFSFAAPSVWNSLPLNVRSAPDISEFRSLLKTHLFEAAFVLN